MCTVSYIPTQNNGFIWTQNRDESPSRASAGLIMEDELIYPKDPLAGGTWIALSQKGRLISLMNGAWETLPYQKSTVKSRGQVLLDAIRINDIHDFLNNYELAGILDFTMLIYDANQLWELRWDQHKRYIQALDPEQAHVWSSVSLYPCEVRKRRKEIFEQYFMKEIAYTTDSILDFHKLDRIEGLEEGIQIDRSYVKTVSITQIDFSLNKKKVFFENLNQQKRQTVVF